MRNEKSIIAKSYLNAIMNTEHNGRRIYVISVDVIQDLNRFTVAFSKIIFRRKLIK